ncbi:hypothetical protein HG535_0A05650 [Zygotorulaspora mrakii]|uniref:Phosphatidylinositol N-acetylglucosaminyltransferase n=1 Tax=Zygotorulaspora mrakii TaxID=42260 RepID=A0A7H9AX05_ZYGMR|nr:uncharacterized protein HG535_0A05650 [Zygotorulaspora mrakii]QLG70624.1 hypothetical protein HG535_0A05650 [Zygotorulaspora mrakii]
MVKPWKRLLWIKQEDYPDNYTDPAFIDLITRLRYKGKSAKPSNNSSSVHQIRSDLFRFYNKLLNTVFVYIIFVFIYNYRVNPVSFAIFVTILVSWLLSRSNAKHYAFGVKSSLVITFAMLTLSPILKSLSKTTASDSIWTLSFWLSIAYVGSLSSNVNAQTSNLSTNLLLAIVILLASRFQSTAHVFCFLLICVQLNVILPNLINLSNKYISFTINLSVYGFLTCTLGWSYTFLALAMSFFYLFVLPQWFVYWQTYYRGYESSLSRVWEAQKPILD